ncbi:hypothetical protein C8R43DRAFT_1122809 [Mycena crocata]|nr:hypothetical protein C8R43DRAFT_1122809 [Mycena crocata]
MPFILPKTTFRDRLATNRNWTEADILNSGNAQSEPAAENDVTVVGGGIHGLMYAIHARMEAEYLLRFFGLHSGLEFFFLDRDKPDEYTVICNNGPPPELEGFEGGHTSHICFPEGWSTSSSAELCKMFGCKMKWNWSIGYACRDDTTYPADLASYGSSEGERRFNFITKKYKKLGDVIPHFVLLPDYHGKTGNFVVTVGDGIGFTNPLLSPGINAGMASTTFAAELTVAAIKTKTEEERLAVWKKYDDYCAGAVPSLNLMNQFLYLTFMHPMIGPRIGFLWTIVIGHALPKYSLPRSAFTVDLPNFPEYAIHWLWGSQVADWVKVAEHTTKKLIPLNLDEPVPQDIVDDVINFSEKVKEEALAAGNGMRRSTGGRIDFRASAENAGPGCLAAGTGGSVVAAVLCGPSRIARIRWNVPPTDLELNKFAMISPNTMSVGQVLVEYLKNREMDCKCHG